MYTQVEKTKENKSRGIVNSVGQKKSNVKQGFRFIDNRSEAIQMKLLQDKIQSSNSNKTTIQRAEKSLGEAKSAINDFYEAMLDERTPAGASYGITRTDVKGDEYTYYNCGFPVKKLGDDYVSVENRNKLRTWWKNYGYWWNTGRVYDNVKYMDYDKSNDKVLFNFHLYYK